MPMTSKDMALPMPEVTIVYNSSLTNKTINSASNAPDKPSTIGDISNITTENSDNKKIIQALIIPIHAITLLHIPNPFTV